jgi:hypothetical protein
LVVYRWNWEAAVREEGQREERRRMVWRIEAREASFYSGVEV